MYVARTGVWARAQARTSSDNRWEEWSKGMILSLAGIGHQRAMGPRI